MSSAFWIRNSEIPPLTRYLVSSYLTTYYIYDYLGLKQNGVKHRTFLYNRVKKENPPLVVLHFILSYRQQLLRT